MHKSSRIKVWSIPTIKSLSDLWYYQNTLHLLVIYQTLQHNAFILCNTSVSYPKETVFKPMLIRWLKFFSFFSQSKGKFWDRTPNYNAATSSMSLLATYSLYALFQVTPQCQCNLYSSGMLCSMDCLSLSSYNKSQQGALFLNFILVKNSTCFGQTYCTSSEVKLVTKVLGQLISPIFMGQSVQEVCWEHIGTKLYSEWCGQWLVRRKCDASQKG
jgi:hypothetical protein